MPKHADIHDPMKSKWADYVAVQAQCGNLSAHTVNSQSGNSQPQLSQLTEPLWTDPGLKS